MKIGDPRAWLSMSHLAVRLLFVGNQKRASLSISGQSLTNTTLGHGHPWLLLENFSQLNTSQLRLSVHCICSLHGPEAA